MTPWKEIIIREAFKLEKKKCNIFNTLGFDPSTHMSVKFHIEKKIFFSFLDKLGRSNNK